MVHRIIVDLERGRRAILYPEGGMDLECHVKGFGWCLDNDAEVPDAVVLAHLQTAAQWLNRKIEQLDYREPTYPMAMAPQLEWSAEDILRQDG